jgi:hypothetical protein
VKRKPSLKPGYIELGCGLPPGMHHRGMRFNNACADSWSEHLALYGKEDNVEKLERLLDSSETYTSILFSIYYQTYSIFT